MRATRVGSTRVVTPPVVPNTVAGFSQFFDLQTPATDELNEYQRGFFFVFSENY